MQFCIHLYILHTDKSSVTERGKVQQNQECTGGRHKSRLDCKPPVLRSSPRYRCSSRNFVPDALAASLPTLRLSTVVAVKVATAGAFAAPAPGEQVHLVRSSHTTNMHLVGGMPKPTVRRPS